MYTSGIKSAFTTAWSSYMGKRKRKKKKEKEKEKETVNTLGAVRVCLGPEA